nr:replication initiator protein A [Novosphingobium sp. AAP83]
MAKDLVRTATLRQRPCPTRPSRAYFDITGGRERWLYKVARKHAGCKGEEGFAISTPVLFEKSGAEGEYRRFKFETPKRAEKNALPGYGLAVETGKGAEPLLRMPCVDGKDGAQTIPQQSPDTQNSDSLGTEGKRSLAADQDLFQRGTAHTSRTRKNVSPGKHQPELINASGLVRKSIASLSDSATRGFMTDETIEHLRQTCPGWDLHTLHAGFET